jgi:hypothetical protein
MNNMGISKRRRYLPAWLAKQGRATVARRPTGNSQMGMKLRQ